MVLALSAQMGWHIHQMDVKTAFLNEVIEEEVYIEHAVWCRDRVRERICGSCQSLIKAVAVGK